MIIGLLVVVGIGLLVDLWTWYRVGQLTQQTQALTEQVQTLVRVLSMVKEDE